MMAKKKKNRHLTILLIKEEYKDYKSVLKEAAALNKYELKTSLPFKGAMFVQPTRDNPPPWLVFIEGGVKGHIELSNNASNSAILFIKASSRLFALTFGHGRYLLNQNSFERDFGLKVALNTVNPEKLRSIDVRTFEELPLYTRQQASVASSIDVFDIDINSDLLRAVTGEPTDEDFALRVTGADSLAINIRTDLADVGKKCDEILSSYKSRKYKKYFSWIDHLQPVREPALRETLDAQLLEIINKNNIEDIHLCPPEPLNWEEVDGFLYGPEQESNDFRTDLNISDYLSLMQDKETVTIELLKRHQVIVKFLRVGEPLAMWPVYKCVVSQTEFGKYLYVLTAGQWFQIDKRFADRVLKDLKAIPNQDNYLVNAKVGEKEGDYNERAANSLDGFVLMDKIPIRSEGAATNIEFCDLFSKDKRIVHVKRKTRSATLSHLFAQGAVSAELFSGDSTFRNSLRSKLKDLKPDLRHLVPADRPETWKYQIVYAIITKGNKKWPDSLPFFSQLYLRQNVQRLINLGYDVLLARIRLE